MTTSHLLIDAVCIEFRTLFVVLGVLTRGSILAQLRLARAAIILKTNAVLELDRHIQNLI